MSDPVAAGVQPGAGSPIQLCPIVDCGHDLDGHGSVDDEEVGCSQCDCRRSRERVVALLAAGQVFVPQRRKPSASSAYGKQSRV